MQIRKWLALLVSAALALSLLAGCGGKNQSLGQVILDLLDGQYANVTVEIDPDLEADLRQAVNEGETEEEIRAALEKILGSGVSFRLIGDGQQGDSAWNLILYPGNDPAAAARSAFTEWNKVFGSLPRDGQYSAGLAMLETENGYAILVQATVDKAASQDDEPDPVTIQGLSATLSNTTYYQGSIFSKSDLTVTATYSDGSTKDIDPTQYTLEINGQPAENYRFTSTGQHTITVSFGGQTATVTIPVSDNVNGYYEDTDGSYVVTGTNGLQKLFDTSESNSEIDALSATITLTTDQVVTGTFGDFLNPFTGTLQSADPNKKVTITLAGENRTLGLFEQIGDSRYGIKGGGTVENLKIQLTVDIISFAGNNQTSSGAVAGTNYGTIQNCEVDLDGHSITDTYGDGRGGGTRCAVGGIAGVNQGTISGCSVNMGTGSRIAVTYSCEFGGAVAGGIAGSNTSYPTNNAIVTNCTVTGSGTITATLDASSTNEVATKIAAAGGLVGYNDSDGAVSDGPASDSITITAQYGNNDNSVNASQEIGNASYQQDNGVYAGTSIGFQDKNS